MPEINEKILEKIGLSRNETKVYLSLLKLGSASVSEIALKANIHRVNIYDSLKRLEEKGLVSSVTKDEKSYFEAASPKEIENIIAKKQEELKDANNIIPELMAVYHEEKNKQAVHHYFGQKGIQTIYNHMIEISKECYTIGATGVMRDYFPVFIQQFERRFVEKNIKWNILYYHRARGVKLLKNCTVKYLPKNMQFMPMTIYLYNGWVAIISFDSMIGIEIQSDQVYHGFLKYFNWLWSISEE